ncbi:MAG TPA: hypothetical protein VLT57_06950 [Bryobacteraceae bacterium]|nr:hypothetical protein [Bryobacteraceae bacterium]
MSDLLSRLTAERLEDDAEWYSVRASELRAGAGDSPAPDCRVMRDQAGMFERAAAICEVLAGAERAMASDYFIRAIAVGVPTQFYCGRPTGGEVPFTDRYPTLIAALASVAKQEET